MPIVTLLNKLEADNRFFDCYINGVQLYNQQINCFTVDHDLIWILTEDSHEINIRIGDFSYVEFDAIVHDARTSAEMVDCLRLLDDEETYDAYLRKSPSSEGLIVGFYRIRPNALSLDRDEV